jgi:mRNA interferase HigB
LLFGKIALSLQRNLVNTTMRVIKKQALIEYYTTHPQAKDALEDWYAKTEDAQWNNFADIRQTFNSVDYVGNQHYVFNIKGNDFRLVVVIKFTPQLVFIRFVGSHAEYDRITNISNL